MDALDVCYTEDRFTVQTALKIQYGKRPTKRECSVPWALLYVIAFFDHIAARMSSALAAFFCI